MKEINHKEELEYLRILLKASLNDYSTSESREMILLIIFALRKIDDGKSLKNIQYLGQCI